MGQISQMDLIKANIEYGARGTGNKEITENILNEWRGSETIKNMISADNYYRVRNEKIETKTRDYINPETNEITINKTLSNVKSKTAKYRKIVNQKVRFALSKPFVISCDDDKYKKEWDNFLNKKTRKVITRTGKQAINKGIAFIYPWINEKGELQLIDTASETIYPAWSDIAHTELDAVVRDYTVDEYTNQSKTTKQYVEFWDRQIFQKFVDYSNGEGSGDLQLIDAEIAAQNNDELSERASVIHTHMSTRNGEGISWNRVPFIPFKGVDDELSALAECKDDVDNYDLVKSKGIDSTLDDIDAVLVVKNISAELNELTKARKIIQNSRIVSVDEDGDARFEKVDVNIQSVKEELDLIKKDIINDTDTVDVTTIEFGSNPSGKAMRMFFEPLNQWCDGFEEEFQVFMENLKYFFDMWLSWKGGFGSFEELQKKAVEFVLDRDLLIDESEIIDNITKLEGELSQETKDELNPYIESHEKEEERRKEDLKKQQENDELFQLQQTINKNKNIDEDEENDENNQNLEE